LSILLHAALWYLLVLRPERAVRIAALPAQGSSMPRTFHPDPIVEWRAGLITVSVVAVITTTVVLGWAGLMSDSRADWALTWVAAGVLVAALVARRARARVLTLRVDRHCISYARGRDEPLQWFDIQRADIVLCKEGSYRGKRWIVLRCKDRRRNIKIAAAAIVDYPTLRDVLRVR
jgi:hypothetical protein